MARTIEEIYNEIVAEKDNQPSLSGLLPSADNLSDLLSELNSASKVAIWRLWAFLMATAIWAHEILWDDFKAEVQAIADAAEPQTAQWFQKRMLEFQYPDALVIIDDVPQYSLIDLQKRIVKRAAVVSLSGSVLFKCAKLSGTDPVPLDALEQQALESYLIQLGYPGMRYQIINQDADTLKVTAEIFYNAQLDVADVQADVEDAINDYLANLEFNGVVRLQKIVDAIQGVDGVIDVRMDDLQAKAVSTSYAAVTDSYQTVAGYIKIDPTAGSTLADTLTFTAN